MRLWDTVTPEATGSVMQTLKHTPVLTASERDRLVRLLQAVPINARWAVEHRHGPLLCALGVIEAPDDAYAHAAARRFADASELHRRARALLEELAREGATRNRGVSLRRFQI